jgi:uncharacterized protein YdaL
MHKRIVCLCLILIMGLLGLLPAASAQGAEAPDKVLLLFDSLAKGTPREGNVAELQRLLASRHAEVTLLSLDQYEQGAMATYDQVITVINAPDLSLADKAYLEDLEPFKGKYLHIGYNPPGKLKQALHLTVGQIYGSGASLTAGSFQGEIPVRDMPYIVGSPGTQAYGNLVFNDSGQRAPYAVSRGNDTYVSFLEQGNISTLAMAEVLWDWLPTESPAQTYLVIKEIYPFSDLALLKETADRLYDAGIPFAASVRPVFRNTDYPAMQRYLEALKYVQSRNGAILLNSPVVMPSISSSDHSLGEKMSGFIDLLTSNGIAPLGIGAEMYWAYDKEYATAGMGYFDSAVLFPDERIMHMEPTNSSKGFSSSLYSVPLQFLSGLSLNGKALPSFPLDTAITVDLPVDADGLQVMLQRLKGYWISFADYKLSDHRTATNKNTITSSQGTLVINGSTLNIDYIPSVEVDSNYQYAQEQVKSFTRLFSVQNQFFIVAIIVSLLFFGGLLIIGYRMYRRKYME